MIAQAAEHRLQNVKTAQCIADVKWSELIPNFNPNNTSKLCNLKNKKQLHALIISVSQSWDNQVLNSVINEFLIM